MNVSLSDHNENLVTALRELKPTGENGFEGLVGAALRVITGIPFRLANSGYQRGLDGKAAFEGAVAFEAKLYKDDLPRKDVLSKIPDLTRHHDHADLVWVLGATCIVPSQLADDLRADGVKEGISVLILDWVPSDFPRLAVALVMGGDEVKKFLSSNLKSQDVRDKALSALDYIRTDAKLPLQEQAIIRSLDAPGMATAMAERANAKWFEETLSDRAVARSELGQPLAPRDTAVTVLDRNELVNILSPYFLGIPSDDVVSLHSEEGCGKSWIVIQSWLAQSDKPLLVFAAPDDFSETATQDDIEALLIIRLITQTGEVRNEESAIRWRRRLRAWKASGKPSRPRVVLVIDGINQRPNRAWGKIISNVSTYVNRRGGRVIFTARSHYFNTRVKKALTCATKEIEVPKWSAVERDLILRKSNVPVNTLSLSVAEFLRNPRILSIALEVFHNDVGAFEELSVDRLLFEHIMAGVRQDFGDDPVEFLENLQKHARELLARATAQTKDDLYIFASDVPAVADGRFFKPVNGEPRKYELSDDGLVLALGLSVIETLRRAERNKHDLDDALREVIEPIEALDRTAEAVIAAISVTAADDDAYSPEIACALIKGFSELQNPPSDALAALISFARTRPQVFTETARDLSLQSGHRPNFDWIQTALVEIARSGVAWILMEDEVRRWLRAYSLSPERRMSSYAGRDPEEKVAEERARRQSEIDNRLTALSSAERNQMRRLIPTDGDIDALSMLALLLLAGKKLETFAESLADWSFANAFNSSFNVPTKEFLALVGLNRQDWAKTRSALLRECENLRIENVSETGKWALLRILRATGDSKDDQEANMLYEELTKNRPQRFENENAKNAIEPCDTSATSPANLNEIAERYTNLDVTTLRQVMGQTQQDRVFVEDRPILARFALNVAVEKHRKFADDVAERTAVPLRQGLLELREHSALITAEQAQALVAKWENALAVGNKQGLPDDDSMLLQYELLITFPFLDADRQIEIMLATNGDQPLLSDLVYETRTPGSESFDRFLKEAISSAAEYKQHLLLEIAAATEAEISNETITFARSSISSKSERLRSSALGLAARSAHSDLLMAVAESGWEHGPSKNRDSYENWYGSLALLKAAEAGLADEGAVLDRISPRLYGRGALMLKGPAVNAIARRIDASFRIVAGLSVELVAPEIVLEADNAVYDEPIRFSILEREPRPENPEDFFRRLSENNDEFRDRQNRNYNAYLAFCEELTMAKACIILDDLTHEQVAAVVTAAPEMVWQWCDLFMGLNDAGLPAVHNFILLLAAAISDTNPEKSAALLERTTHSHPLVRFTFGRSGVDLGSISAWKGRCSPSLDALRRKRLDCAVNDQAIAVEVLSALHCDHGSFLEAYIADKLARPEPAEVARGLIVAGYCDQSQPIEWTLGKYEGTAGLPGKAYAAAISAYSHNIWARHWFKIMCETNDPATFWQAGVLFAQCVDGRFQTWKDTFAQTGGPIAAFGSSLNNTLKWRYEKLERERQKRLFGQDAPAAIFVC
jgi:hypothetical protein